MDDGDVSGRYPRRKSAGGEPLTRRLREVMHDALPCELPELAVPAPGAELLAVIQLQHREVRLTHPALVIDIVINSGVMSLLQPVVFLVLDHRSR